MTDVTRILSAIEQGDPKAAEQLLPLVYDELRKLAAQKLAQEKPGQTLQATALVHEAYLRLVDVEQVAALEQPRPLLRRRGRGHAPHPRRQRPRQATPQARRRRSAGRARSRPSFAGERLTSTLLALDEALEQLERRGPRQAPSWSSSASSPGLDHGEAAEALGHLAAHRRPTLGVTPGPGSTTGSGGDE